MHRFKTASISWILSTLRTSTSGGEEKTEQVIDLSTCLKVLQEQHHSIKKNVLQATVLLWACSHDSTETKKSTFKEQQHLKNPITQYIRIWCFPAAIWFKFLRVLFFPNESNMILVTFSELGYTPSGKQQICSELLGLGGTKNAFQLCCKFSDSLWLFQ